MKLLCGLTQDILLIAWRSNLQAAKCRDLGTGGGKAGFFQSRAKKGKQGREGTREGQVSAFHLDIQDDTSGARETAISN